MRPYINAGQGDKNVYVVEIVFRGPGGYDGFERTLATALGKSTTATGVKIVSHRKFVPPTGTPEEQAGFVKVQ